MFVKKQSWSIPKQWMERARIYLELMKGGGLWDGGTG